MAKKTTKIEKETKKIIEVTSDLVKKKDNGYKFKGGKKKQIKRVKRTCAHWIIRKGKAVPTVVADPDNPDNWKCRICGKTFPMKPLTYAEYNEACDQFLKIVNQAFFYSVRMGGNSDDTKVFLRLKELIPMFNKIVINEMKHLNKRKEYEERKSNTDTGNQFNAYSAYNYRL